MFNIMAEACSPLVPGTQYKIQNVAGHSYIDLTDDANWGTP